MSQVRTDVRTSRWRYLVVLIIFLLGILIGWLLAPRCPACGGSMTPTNAAAGGGAKLSAGQGVGERNSGSPGNGPTAAGGAAGGTPIPGPEAAGRKIDGANRNGLGAELAGVGTPVSGEGSGEDSTGQQVLKAKDFRYDKTGLPRYAQSVNSMGSILSRRVGEAAYHSECAIVTSSPFADVVDWYKTQLPQGWRAQVVGDVNALAKQASMENIMSALTAATQSNGAPPSDTPPSAASNTDAAGVMQVAMFSPPANTAGQPGVLIQHVGQTVQITMSKDGVDQ